MENNIRQENQFTMTTIIDRTIIEHNYVLKTPIPLPDMLQRISHTHTALGSLTFGVL